MASLHGTLSFTGSLSNISAYTIRGRNKVFLRTKGGASKKTIQNSPAFEPTRNLNNEWKGVTKAAKEIRKGLPDLKLLADYNISGPLNALVKKIQTADTINPKGKRAILFSRQPDFISSFNYNRQTLFDTVIRQPMSIEINKLTGIADVTIPALQPAVNFFAHPLYAYYRILLSFGAVGDYIWNEAGSRYRSASLGLPKYKPVYTPWAGSNTLQPSASYQLAPDSAVLPGPEMILVFGAGIQYGMPVADGSIQPVPYAGAARILKSI
jgi:hypothetical protein